MAVAQQEELVILTSLSRTATQQSADIPTNGCQTLNLVYDQTVGATNSNVITIDGKDPVSGKYYNLLTSAALTSVATTRLKIGQTIAASANLIAQDYIPNTIRITVTAGNANAATYSVGISLQP